MSRTGPLSHHQIFSRVQQIRIGPSWLLRLVLFYLRLNCRINHVPFILCESLTSFSPPVWQRHLRSIFSHPTSRACFVLEHPAHRGAAVIFRFSQYSLRDRRIQTLDRSVLGWINQFNRFQANLNTRVANLKALIEIYNTAHQPAALRTKNDITKSLRRLFKFDSPML